MKKMCKFENNLSPPLMDEIFQVRKDTSNLRYFQKLQIIKKIGKNGSGENVLLCKSTVESGSC